MQVCRVQRQFALTIPQRASGFGTSAWSIALRLRGGEQSDSIDARSYLASGDQSGNYYRSDGDYFDNLLEAVVTDEVKRVKYLIIGAGPGGLQMGYFLQKHQRDYLILEKNETAGSFFAKYPIHRKLISINKKENFFSEEEFNWRHDWNSLLSDDPEMNFTRYSDDLYPSADTLHHYLQDFAGRFSLNISHGITANKIEKMEDGGFLVSTTDGKQYSCAVLLLGLGSLVSRVPREIEGIELATGYGDQCVDPEHYRNKRVCILGQGNAAFETAESLVGIASYVHVLTKRPVKMAWNTHFVGDLRAVNNGIYDMYQLKSMHAVLNPRVRSIRRTTEGLLETSHEYDYPNAARPGTLKLTREYDIIINCTGWKWVDEELFDDSSQPDTWYNGKFPVLTPNWESANISNMFFIGGAMQGNDRQAASGFIHGYRYGIRTLHKLLEEKYEGVEYPSTKLAPFDWGEFLDWMYDRMSVSAALFQLWGVLCDALVISSDLKEATLYKELPRKSLDQRDFGDQHVLVMTLEFGFNKFNQAEQPAISFMGPSDPLDTSCAAFLHPVIRHMHNGNVDEFHFGDSLLARWDKPHGKGGAVMSYHYNFQKWIEERVGFDLDLPEPVAGGNYQEWTQEEIDMWESARSDETVQEPECFRPI